MYDSKLEIILSARDMTAKTFESFKGRLSALTKSVFSLQGGLAVLAGGYGLSQLVGKMNIAADAAGDFSETFSKVQTLFGSDAAGRLRIWGDSAATAMGLSSQAALDAVGNVGNMFQQLGATNRQSIDLSTSMVQLSADIASFHNVAGGANEVLDAMQSAFRGEYDALQRYIPTINAAAVQEQALADTHKQRASDLTDLEKATAAYKIIMHDAGAAVGDFARTSGGLANQERILEARLQNITRELGTNLLPVKLRIVTETNNWIAANQDLINQKLPEYIDTAADAFMRFMELASLRSVSNTFAQAVELSKQGLLDINEFAMKGFIERQRIVDDILTKQKQIGIYTGKIDASTPGYAEYKSATAGGPATTEPIPTPSVIDSSISRTSYGGFTTEKNNFDTIDDYYSNHPMIDIGGESDVDTYQKILEERKRLFEQYNGEYIDMWQRQAADVEEVQKRADEMMVSNATDTAALMENAFSGWATSFSSSLNDMLWEGEANFAQIATSFGKMVTQMLIQIALLKAAKGVAGVLHSGGMVGAGGGRRSVESSVFIGAPRYHDGLLPGEFPAILKQGEYVLTPDQMQAMKSRQEPTRMKESRPQAINIANIIDPREIDRYLSSASGQSSILNVLSRNAQSVKRMVR